MDIAVVVAAHKLENPKHLEITINKIKQEDVDVFLVVDEPVFREFKVDKYLISPTKGVGTARNYAIMNALDYDCVVLADSHSVVIEGSHEELCKDAVLGGAIPHVHSVSYDKYPSLKPTIGGWWGRMYSLTLNNYYDVYRCDYKPWSMEPHMAFNVNVLRRLIDISGYAIISEGWGHELSELTMSLSMLGYTIKCSKVKVLHRANTADLPFWKDRWDDEYRAGWLNSAGVYVKKIIDEGWREKSKFNFAVSYVKPYQLDAIVKFRGSIVKTAEEVYREFYNKTGINLLS